MPRIDTILLNGRITTNDPALPEASAMAIAGERIHAVGADQDVAPLAETSTRRIDLCGRRAIPGLIDSHMHVIRGGLNFTLELRWDGVRTLADAMAMLAHQVARTPSPQWVRVVGGFCEHQFVERRLPTLDELNAVAPQTPVFVLHLYDRALLNRAALRAVGYDRNTPDPPGARIERNSHGEPTGMLIAAPNALILYSTLAKGPKLDPDQQKNSTRHFMREMNRLGVTSVIDAGGGFQNYPEDYRVIEALHREGAMTLRIAYNLFTQRPKQELADFSSWSRMVRPGSGDDRLRPNGAGEMLVYTAADFEDFRVLRPDMPAEMETELEPVVRLLAQNGWPFRLHATYDQTIGRALDVFERVHREVPIDRLHWFFDHAETISAANMERVARLGGGIAIQHRMAYQGEYFIERYGAAAAAKTPPIVDLLAMGLPVGAGTDATRVASYNPWICLYWLLTGRTVGGASMYARGDCLDRATALKLWTTANTWFSNEVGKKGAIVPGQLADVTVLSSDYFAVADERIPETTSVLTLLGGVPVWGDEEFAEFAPPMPPILPDWSPVRAFSGYSTGSFVPSSSGRSIARSMSGAASGAPWAGPGCMCWAL